MPGPRGLRTRGFEVFWRSSLSLYLAIHLRSSLQRERTRRGHRQLRRGESECGCGHIEYCRGDIFPLLSVKLKSIFCTYGSENWGRARREHIRVYRTAPLTFSSQKERKASTHHCMYSVTERGGNSWPFVLCHFPFFSVDKILLVQVSVSVLIYSVSICYLSSDPSNTRLRWDHHIRPLPIFFRFWFLNWLKDIIISPWRARLCYRLCRIQKGQECLYTAIWVMWGRVYQWCPGELWLHAWHMRLWKHFLPSSLHRRSGETLGHLPLWFYMPCAKNTEHVNVFFSSCL